MSQSSFNRGQFLKIGIASRQLGNDLHYLHLGPGYLLKTEQNFGDRLAAAVHAKRSAVCVGLDPRWPSLPDTIRSDIEAADIRSVASATSRFCQLVIDAVAHIVPIVKPQAAFFEQLGPPGMDALYQTVQHARRAGLMVLLDGKRGDIGSTAEAYADAYMGSSSPWGCDALTVNPFLGEDTLMPFTQVADQRSAGIFVLVKTSNPGSGFLQDMIVGGQPVYRKIADLVQSLAIHRQSECGYGNCGAVVGATYPEQLAELRSAMPNAWLLIPGYGAQGGSAEDVISGFDARGLGAIVNSSRGIIFAYQQSAFKHLDWQQAVETAAKEMTLQLPRPE